MTAEERLKELYDKVQRVPDGKPVLSILIMPEHIDLIADLVVERLKGKDV